MADLLMKDRGSEAAKAQEVPFVIATEQGKLDNGAEGALQDVVHAHETINAHELHHKVSI